MRADVAAQLAGPTGWTQTPNRPHGLGRFEAYGLGDRPDTPFHEDEERLPYRTGGQAPRRSHTVLGFATGKAMNRVVTLCAYASLCRERDLPFVFPGSQTQWNAEPDLSRVASWWHSDADLTVTHPFSPRA